MFRPYRESGGILQTGQLHFIKNEGSGSRTTQAQRNLMDVGSTEMTTQLINLYHSSLLTSYIQVGVRLYLPAFITSKTLEDSSILRMQSLDPQPATQQDFVAWVLQLAERNRVLIPDEGGNGNSY